MPCTASSYPRTLPAVITADEAAVFAAVHDRIQQRPDGHKGKYYHLLNHLSQNLDDPAWSALASVERRLAAEFSRDFVVVNDFFSLRVGGKPRMFPYWHQDLEFWLTTPACTGFNVWLLLAHSDHNRSIDVLDEDANSELYASLYRRHLGRVDYSDDHLPPQALEELNYHDTHDGKPPVVSNVPLDVGDALIVRQLEVHRTDAVEIPAGSWRLGLGFKVLERTALTRLPTRATPMGYSLAWLRARWPHLHEELVLGRPYPTVYNRTALAEEHRREEHRLPLLHFHAGRTVTAWDVQIALFVLLAVQYVFQRCR